MLFEAVEGHAFGFLTYPMLQHEYFHCNDGDFDCNRAPIKENLPYCDKEFLKREHPGKVTMHGVDRIRNVSRCYTDDIHMNAGPTIFIPTMKTWINQSWNDEHQEWFNDGILEVYMRDIESFLFRAQSSARVDKLDIKRESVNMAGAVMYSEEDMSMCTIPCHAREGHPEDCSEQVLDKAIPSCLEALPGVTESSIFASKWGDTFNVAMLLQLANIELDSPRPSMDGLTYRQSGGVVDIGVRFQNMDNFHWSPFSPHFLDTTVTYSYNVKMSNDFSGSAVYITRVLSSRDPGSYTRTLERTTGLRVHLSTSGLLAGFKIGQCMTTLAVTTSLFAVAILIVESVLINLYQRCGHKDALTAAYMFDVYKKDESLPHHTFSEILDQHVPNAYHGYMEIDKEENLYHEVERSKKKKTKDEAKPRRGGSLSEALADSVTLKEDGPS